MTTIAFCFFPYLTVGNTTNKHNNAIWMGYRWVVDYHSPEEIADTLSIIESHDINTIYVNVGSLKKDGRIDTPRYCWDFVEFAKRYNDSLTVMACVGGDGYSIDISDSMVRSNIADLCSRIVFYSGFFKNMML